MDHLLQDLRYGIRTMLSKPGFTMVAVVVLSLGIGVSSNYFAMFGVPLFQGRTFTDAEERPGSNSTVAIVSYSFWRKQGDPNLLGKSIRINGRIFTIVGVAPEGFTGTTALISSELFLPLGAYQLVMNDFEGHGRPLDARDN